MLNREILEAQLSELPLYVYHFLEPKELEFSSRIRWICEHECPMYGKSWACPPAVGTVEECRGKCLGYQNALMIATITEVNDIANIEETLATRPGHEAITNQVRDLFRQQGIEPYILSTESCAECERCAYLDGEPCRLPERMHPCLESHGINILTVIEDLGLSFQYGENVVTWFSLLLY
jgi:predicted metal-binding protein